eukprot:TRINITY_DN3958_c0_g1_i1.p2 TRINITY_DN3958_c0_g1~~TRINITY_DN3958_c0_g1_i1.p2  ORF type:complete len:116 (-),score=40.04 TRINITY_DN3958_c0_g1_i1:221-568(-)
MCIRDRSKPDAKQAKAKQAATSNRTSKDKQLASLDQSTEAQALAKCPVALATAIKQGRCVKTLTQAQLANKINVAPKVVQEYESGKAVPNQQIISKLSRALGVKLSMPKRSAGAA